MLIDILNIIPEEVECFIQAPSLENLVIQNMMENTEFDYYKLIKLNKETRKNFIDQIRVNFISDYFQNIQIKQKGKLLFEGFDGIEFGILSKSLNIPEWFRLKYIQTKLCLISLEW